jgi:hypothetical protein
MALPAAWPSRKYCELAEHLAFWADYDGTGMMADVMRYGRQHRFAASSAANN